jgi:hypothetical protein
MISDSYLSMYVMYFVQGHNTPMAKAQSDASFYASSTIQPVFDSIFNTSCWPNNWWGADAQWTSVGEWTVSWSAFFCKSCDSLSKVKKFVLPDDQNIYLTLLIAGLLAGYAILPFFTRYLVLVIPLLLLFVFGEINERKKMHKYIYISLILLFSIHYYMFWN